MKKTTKEKTENKKDEILKKAKEYGLENNFLFTTTFERYVKQLELLDRLTKEINQGDTMVTKEYVKGRMNLYVNPAFKEYNSCVTATNNTVLSLVKIISSLKGEKEEKKTKMQNPLLKVLNE